MTDAYFYLGPLTGVTWPNGTETILFPRAPIALPDGEYTRTLLAARYLVAGWSLGSASGVAPDSWVISDEIVATGFAGQALISMAGGEYSINNGPWTSAIGMVLNGDTVRVRVRSAPVRSSVPVVGVLMIGGFSGSFVVTTLDDEPGAFSFTAQSGVPVDIDVVSNTITVADINVPVPISITGGSYSINSGAFTTEVGSVSQGDRVTLKVRSPSDPGRTATVVLSIGDRSADFVVSTVAVDSSPTTFAFAAQSGVQADIDVTSNAITVTDINVPVPISVTGGSYSINSGAFTTEVGSVSQGDRVTLKVRSPSSPGQAATATLTIGDRSADFIVTTLVVAPPPALDLEQYVLRVRSGSPSKCYFFVGDGYLLLVGFDSVSRDIVMVRFLPGGDIVGQMSISIADGPTPEYVVLDADSIYLASGNRVYRLSHNGDLLWCASIGLTGIDGIDADASGIYFIGWKSGSSDQWIGKISLDGARLWVKKMAKYSSSYAVALYSVFSSAVADELYIGGITGNWTFHAALSKVDGTLLSKVRHSNIGGDKYPHRFVDDPGRGAVWVSLVCGSFTTNSYAGLLNINSGSLLSGQSFSAAEIYPGDARAIAASRNVIRGLGLTSTGVSPDLENSMISISDIQTDSIGGHTYLSGVGLGGRPTGFFAARLARPIGASAKGNYGDVSISDTWAKVSLVIRPITFAGDYLPANLVDDASIVVAPVATTVTTQESHYVIDVMPHE
jgi:hypothetical protein